MQFQTTGSFAILSSEYFNSNIPLFILGTLLLSRLSSLIQHTVSVWVDIVNMSNMDNKVKGQLSFALYLKLYATGEFVSNAKN